MSTLRGIAVSPGVAVGPALVVEREAAPVFRVPLAAEGVEAEVARLEGALEQSREQLRAVKERMQQEVGAPHAYIFDAHLLMLDDPLLRTRVVEVVRSERVNAEWALRTVSEELHELFNHFSDVYLRERSTDLDDVIGRVHLSLRGSPEAPSLERLPGPVILVAADLSPSEAAELDWDKVLAVVTDVGSSTYHTAIIARSLGVPAVVGLKDATKRTPAGSLVVVDGTRGEFLIEPSEARLAELRTIQEADRVEDDRLRATRELASRTADGVDVLLEANVEFPEEAATARLYGASGIGLFRSEYLLGGRGTQWPTEAHQVDVYRRLIEQTHPHPVTVRTWDIGLEALGPSASSSPNPALGERALRLLPRSREPFRVQLRALLRAGEHGPVRIMFPFVGGVDDLHVALALLEEAREELRREGIRFREDVPVGLNLEVPSAAVVADLLAPEIDFFSVGTNDLIQYLLAVDRTDPRVSGLYEPLHPAVLRTLAQIADAARSQDRPLSVCGEMAGQPLEAVLLVGLGFRQLSMAPSAIPRVKEAVRAVRESDARRLAQSCLSLRTCGEIVALVRRELPEAAAAGAVERAQ